VGNFSPGFISPARMLVAKASTISVTNPRGLRVKVSSEFMVGRVRQNMD
jgi:hypothetical protein